jgi:DNA-binding transcriptional ArsR family regulator
MANRDTLWLANAFGALSNENRLRMFERLQLRAIECNARDGCCDFSDRCCNLGELASDLDITQATASHHLKELSRNGLVETRRKGRFVHCAINDEAIERLNVFLGRGSLNVGEFVTAVGISTGCGSSCSDNRTSCSD